MSENKIDRFVGEYAFLSNFHPSTVTYEGKRYPTVEHAFQAAKTFDENSKEAVRKATTPGDAKKLGRLVSLREGWDEIKVDIMRDLIRRKFQNPFLRPLLLATGDAELIEGNYWNDRFFGVCMRTGVGENHLGRILMEVRDEIRHEKDEEDEVE